MALTAAIPGLCLAGLMFAGCATTQAIDIHPHDAAHFAAWSEQAPSYRVGAGDKVKIDFLLTPELNQDAVIEPDGAVALKGLGRIGAQNLTLAELQQVVERAAAARLLHPIVTVALIEPRAARIIVGGQVAHPGVFPLPARATTLEAVMLAGGLLPESRMDQVVVLRQRDGAPPMLRTIDLRAFVSRGAAKESITLASEDIIFVPRSRIAEVDLWVEENINRLLPFSRGVSYTAGSYKP